MQEVPIQEVTPAATLIQDVTDTASQVASNTDAGIFEMITHSGSTVFVVLMILILCSLFTWAIVFAKIMQYKRVNKECKEFRDIFWKNRNFARIEEATEHLSNNPYVKIFRAGYRELTQIKDKDSASNGYYLDILRRILERSAISELRKLEFGNTFLATVATAAPFVGLFGTVWGIMVAFQGLSAVKTTTLQAVAPGISEALIATAVGLAAAIPASVAYNFFAVKVKNYKEETSGFISEFLSISAKYLVQ
ncbi:MAG: MotA/TolQ/ExbB proton channel family protein [Bdellovibrionota bacterium]|nr:MotA/TolQ/ExbB proton channel family protein [Pseudomonadota bacterium]MDY6090416.1 MotA/TolQ/ExbB proton channel family protein [Bdellovibrionota bacterium]